MLLRHLLTPSDPSIVAYRLEILTWVWLLGSVVGDRGLYFWICCTWPCCMDPGVCEIVTIAEVTAVSLLLLLFWFWLATMLELLEFEVWFGDDTHRDNMLSLWRDRGTSGLKSCPFCSSNILSWLLALCPLLSCDQCLGKSFKFRLTSSFAVFPPSLWNNERNKTKIWLVERITSLTNPGDHPGVFYGHWSPDQWFINNK